MSQEPFTGFMHVAGPQLAKMGLGYVKWLGGDDGFVGESTFVRPVLSDKTLQPYLGELAWHTWNLDGRPDSDFDALNATVARFGKEFWATETGYDPLLNDHDPAAFATWDNAFQYAQIYLRTVTVMHATVLDYWEFASDFPLVSPELQPYPTYYIIKTYEDNLKPGAQVVKAKSDDGKVLSVAAKDVTNNHFFSQAINTSASNKSVTFTGLPNVALALTRSSSTENSTLI